MKKIISDVISMPNGCETSRFVACFASMYMRAENMIDESVFIFCGKQKGDCIGCGDCEDLNRLRKKHGEIYNLYSVVSGYGFMQMDLSNDDHMLRCWDETCDILLRRFDDYIQFTMGFAGYDYIEYGDSADERVVFQAIVRSIDEDRPVLMQFKDGLQWVLVSGYDDAGGLYGYDGSYGYWGTKIADTQDYEGEVFHIREWHGGMSRAIVLNAKIAPSVTMDEVLSRAILIMEEMQAKQYFGNSVKYMLDDDNFADKDADGLMKIRDRISQFIGLPIDMRSVVSWYIGASPEMHDRTNRLYNAYSLINNFCCNTHDTCWIAWRAVGEFMGADKTEWSNGLSNKTIRRVIADVIGIIQNNDWNMLHTLKELKTAGLLS